MGSSSSKNKKKQQQEQDGLPEEERQMKAVLKLLNLYDTVIVVDDSGSMTWDSRWEQSVNSNAGEALAQLAEVAAEYDKDGLDIRFLNSPKTELGVKDPQIVNQLFQRVSPSSGTPIGGKMKGLLADYLERYEKNPDIKRVNYIVITDGAATDEPANSLDGVIVKFAKKLDELNAPIAQVGIQFVQIGNDHNAKWFLQQLDDTLKSTHKIRDMVDTTVNEGPGKLDLIKVLVGGINRRVDAGNIVTN
ncbi:hypothetical protein BDN72DRAFT_125427 [Pluteus cervinus]|uniref:Uncharacterized protein n=1 Tax=Pluteus cervinus TaxID=181527 RepID=A0ACD3AMU1_9AGAR|nr:hypothetical protein BDN72DRAFT_125427 [Pluteus cervinus]